MNPLFKIRKCFGDSYTFGTLLFIYPTKNDLRYNWIIFEYRFENLVANLFRKVN